MLSDEEKFRFDLEGYLVIPGVLSAEECAVLSQQSDHVWPRQAQDPAFRRTASVSLWGADFRNLMDHPKVLPYLIELIGPRVRLDHDYAIYMRHGADSQPIHGGPRRYESDHWYHYNNGTMRNGLMVATWALTDAGPNDGGFVCVPGSHKTNFIDRLPEAVQNQQVMPEYVRQPIVKAGDVILFTEALMHGTRAWQGDHERRVLLFKYSPPHSSWAKQGYDLAAYPEATAQQQRLMAPPSVEDHAKVISDKS
ncbi:MAG: phytanoyl-CoA dioxygenase family protein [Pseudomonadales bacterium]